MILAGDVRTELSRFTRRPTTMERSDHDQHGSRPEQSGRISWQRCAIAGARTQRAIPDYVERFSRDLGSPTSGYFTSWKWKVNIGVKSDKLKILYEPDRPVDHRHRGGFVFESGRDVGVVPKSPTLLPLPQPEPSCRFRACSNTFKTPLKSMGIACPREARAGRSWTSNWASDGALLPTPFDPDRRSADLRHSGIAIGVAAGGVDDSPLVLAGQARRLLPDEAAEAAGVLARWAALHLRLPHRHGACRPAPSSAVRSKPGSWIRSPTTSPARVPYANYNWELFLHVPLAIADFLASQQRFEDARRWLHAVFDPTTERSANNVPQFWRFLPFRQ